VGFHSKLPLYRITVACYREQEATIGQFKEDFRVAAARLIARLGEQDSKIQKMSGQLEVSKPAAQIVLNNH